MKKTTLIAFLDFFAGLFVGIALTCGILCFFIFGDLGLGLVVSSFSALFVFALFSFFALLAKSMAALLKDSPHERI
ncbi:hypothetical protein ACFOPX_08170 [Helicobacter baculiformis]|uniref:Uncharacterized protein n=1 Tax=Helicobacter baculiformis TaxID=427351 RepID=A0ABV7ZK69_9HELI|nr:hypothetical protein [Helicobacter baculiformis]